MAADVESVVEGQCLQRIVGKMWMILMRHRTRYPPRARFRSDPARSLCSVPVPRPQLE
jgi:hypothetical protein